MSRYVMPVTARSVKENVPCRKRSLLASHTQTSVRHEDCRSPQISTFGLYMIPHRWNIASMLKVLPTIVASKARSYVSYGGLSMLWFLGFRVECWVFELTCVNVERKLLWFHPHDVHLLTILKAVLSTCDWILIMRILPKCCTEPALNCSHIFWLMKPKIALCCLLLRRHFRVRTVIALQWPRSELQHVTGKFELFLYVYQAISLLFPT